MSSRTVALSPSLVPLQKAKATWRSGGQCVRAEAERMSGKIGWGGGSLREPRGEAWRWMTLGASMHLMPWSCAQKLGYVKVHFVFCVCCHCSVAKSHLSVTLWTIAHQALLSVGFSRQEYWSRLPCPPPGDLPNPSALQVDSLSLSHQGHPLCTLPKFKKLFEIKNKAWLFLRSVKSISGQGFLPSGSIRG